MRGTWVFDGPDFPVCTAVVGNKPVDSRAMTATASDAANSRSKPHRSAIHPARNPEVLTTAKATFEMVINGGLSPAGIEAKYPMPPLITDAIASPRATNAATIIQCSTALPEVCSS